MLSNNLSLNETAKEQEALPQTKPKVKQILSTEELSILNQSSNYKGLLQLSGHLGVIVISGYLWGTNLENLAIALPSLVLYGFSLASMFAVVHETTHRTAFANNSLNDVVAWFAGLLSFYNSTFYRRFHKWHHRYTQIPGKDPELNDPSPTNLSQYLVEISGIPWWRGKIKGHFLLALGKLDNHPYIAENAKAEVIRSIRLQLLVYLILITVSLAFKQPWFLIYWLLPLIIGQPILRAILLAEHTGCSNDDNPLTNTRTTLTIWPIRFLMWNMPFHAEHHLYPSFPFHALPKAHQKLNPHFSKVDSGYLKVNQEIITSFTQVSP